MQKIGELVWVFLAFFLTAPLVFSLGARAEVSVEATVDRTAMAKGDTLTLSVRITSEKRVGVEEPRLPNLDKFDLLNKWESSQVQSSMGSGGIQTIRTQVFNYMLATKESGSHRIDPIEVVVLGKVYHTRPIVLAVGPSNQKPPGGRRQAQRPGQQQPGLRTGKPLDPFSQMDDMFNNFFNQNQNQNQNQNRQRQRLQPGHTKDSLFIRAKVSKSKVYVGEQIMVSWYVYAKGHIREIDTLEHPSNKGFWKEDINIATRLNFVNEVVNGVVYRKALLASYALFPLKEGVAVVDSYKVKCVLVGRSIYGFGRPIQYIRSSDPIEIEVVALPSENKPTDFSGAVGIFKVSSHLDGQNLSVNQPVTLKVKFFGQGNAKLIDLPELKLPDTLEVYDTKKESRFFKNGQSEKVFEVLLIPRSPGEFVIPSVSVSAFDPQTGAYYQQKTQEYRLTVVPGEGESVISASPLERREEEDQLKLPEVMASWESQRVWSAGQKIISWIFIYLFVFGFLIWRLIVEFGLAQRKKDLRKLIHLKVRGVEELIHREDWRGVGTAVTNLVYKTLGEVSGLGGASVELDKLILQLPPSVRRELGELIKRQNKVFEVLSFAPEEMLGSLKNREDIVKQVLDIEQTLLKAVDLGLGSEELSQPSHA